MQIPLPHKPVFTSTGDNAGVFNIEGLYPGYGITLGNALRRVLLSSLRGAAVTSFKIEGVDHEFSTIPGVLEDVIQIMLNLKKLRIKLLSDGPETLYIHTKGEKEITGNDIEKNPNVEIINSDLVLMTVTDKKTTITMEIVVERGRGYQTSETMQKEKLPIGMVAIDAIFTPVQKVRDSVENMRVGERTDFNRLLLALETDGSITPEQAFEDAVNILISQFGALVHETENEALGMMSEESKEPEENGEDSEIKTKKEKKAKK
ncbi:MAG: DNA-directed RNA polymerase subunit alpha [Patescibacteria group bacterium]|nr:DNA-directed RNA polymerase subunit alpha [Patescibacteria group bacterium]MDE2437855.1 DNA-directed RNA polymerase subunit alpha [Patescibacteria group bacterium]